MDSFFKIEKLNIYAKVNGGTNHIVTDLSFSMQKGETLAIVGESGCGKTMTAMSILNTLPSNCRKTGKIFLDNVELSNLKKREYKKILGKDISFIPQSGQEFLDPSFSVKSQVREVAKKVHNLPKTELDKLAISKLKEVGLSNAERVYGMYPFQLSGGMAQRVTLAISSICNPKLVIADEATRGIDKETADSFLDNMDKLFTGCKILITHNMDIASRADYILVMKEGKTIEQGKAYEMINNPKTEYTKKLLKAKDYEAIYD